MKIAGVEVGARPIVVAEISNNHNGDLHLCLDLVAKSVAAGADVVKFQAYTPAELVALRGDGLAPDPWGAEGLSMRDLYEQAQTPLGWFLRIAEFCGRDGIPWFSSVFGPTSLTFLEALGCPTYKLAALDYGKRSLARMVAATGKPVVQSARTEKAPKGMALWCPVGYPQAPEPFGDRFTRRGYLGFSYHGTDWRVPAAAMVAGAKVVECHVQLDEAPSVLERWVSLPVSSLAELCAFRDAMEGWV